MSLSVIKITNSVEGTVTRMTGTSTWLNAVVADLSAQGFECEFTSEIDTELDRSEFELAMVNVYLDMLTC